MELGKILMKWSLESKEVDMIFYLYTEHNVGIPAKYIYKLGFKNKFSSAFDALQEETLFSNDPKLRELIRLFPRSKWKRLSEWDNSYGYCLC